MSLVSNECELYIELKNASQTQNALAIQNGVLYIIAIKNCWTQNLKATKQNQRQKAKTLNDMSFIYSIINIFNIVFSYSIINIINIFYVYCFKAFCFL